MAQENYIIYLRKSRADAEAEARGEGETLARHEKALLELARRQKLNVTDIYREIVSGETIAARPVMQRVLAEVEQGRWAGVLVMEVERLARGDTMDQGLVAQTFKFSGAKIITPMKTYDPSNEFDEEYFEFGLFMARREYKVINRRMQRGREASAREGKFLGNHPPYGYVRKKLEREKGYTLEPQPGQADVIRMIFDLYTIGYPLEDGAYRRLGVSLIARRLNEMAIPPQKGGAWSESSIRDILINPVYAGMIRWNTRPHVKRMVDGQITVTRPRARPEDRICVKGLHEPLISTDTFDAAQKLMSCNRPAPIGRAKGVKNPLAGIVVCGVCGRKLVRRPYPAGRGQPDTLMCPNASCSNVSSALHYVEEHILSALRDWLAEYKLKLLTQGETLSPSALASKKIALRVVEAELSKLNKQMERLHDLLEQGVYDVDVFLNRSRILGEQIAKAKASIEALNEEIKLEEARSGAYKNIIPKVQHLLDSYYDLSNPKAQNDLLREVLDKAVYTKTIKGRWHAAPDDFEITIFPRLS